MYCRDCGFQLYDDSNFCSRCGKEVRPPAVDGPQTPSAEIPKKSEAAAAHGIRKSLEQRNAIQQKKKKGAGDIITLVVGMPVLLALLSYAATSGAPQKMGRFTPKNICVAALSAELGLSRDLFRDWKTSSEEIVWLRNRDDNEYECFLSGKEVVWRVYPDGRWRHNYPQGDTEITWSVSGNTIRISRKLSDGSRRAVNYQG